MIVLSISEKKEYRQRCRMDYCLGDEIIFDGLGSNILDLEQYIYPSLFEEKIPTVRSSFLFEDFSKDISPDFVKKLSASPTVFFFEELDIQKDLLNLFKKEGALIFIDKEKNKLVKKDDLFSLASSVVTEDRKKSWINLHNVLSKYPIEGILGIIYWKVRDMMIKNPKNIFYKNMYKELLFAHMNSWRRGLPLDLMIEKVILK